MLFAIERRLKTAHLARLGHRLGHRSRQHLALCPNGQLTRQGLRQIWLTARRVDSNQLAIGVGMDGPSSGQDHGSDTQVAGGHEVFEETRQIQPGTSHTNLALTTADDDVEPDFGGLQINIVVHIDVVVAPG